MICFVTVLKVCHQSVSAKEIEGVQYIRSKRGTNHVLFEGNTFTPNEKTDAGLTHRTWKCSMYYRLKCRARLVTRRVGCKEFLKPPVHEHNHENSHPIKKQIHRD